MKILVLNAGSSSHKLSLFDLVHQEPTEPLWKAFIDWGRKDQNPLIEIDTSSNKIKHALENHDIEQGIQFLLKSIHEGECKVIDRLEEIEMIGHRIVHGGIEFEKPTQIDFAVKEKIKSLIPLAPLHNRTNLQGIQWMEKFFPNIPQIAVFDTAFHVTMPEFIKTYPLPLKWKESGIQRYGFHGISHHYCMERMANYFKIDLEKQKIINCHLGNGCSLCAIKKGKSYETTMGFTPLEGLMMGSRSGSIDPEIVLYLLRQNLFTEEQIDYSLNFDSGLKGIGGSSDMRDLLSKPSDQSAVLAVQMFVHRLKFFIGSLAASLGGVDILNFTAGIGENSPYIREETCKDLDFLGFVIDKEKNKKCHPDDNIGIPSSKKIFVIQTREDWMIARACFSQI